MLGPHCLLPQDPTMRLDRGYDSGRTRDLLEILGYRADIAVKGTPAPIQAGKRWPVERTHSWMNGYGKLRRVTDRRKVIVEFYLYLAATFTVIRRLINRARSRYRWPTRPSHPTPPLTINCRSLLVRPDDRRRPPPAGRDRPG